MKKCLSLLIALTMIMSIVVFPVATQAATPDIPEGATLIFAEDFEEGYATGDLLKSDAKEVSITNTATNKKTLWFQYSDTEKEKVTVETGPAEFNTTKVLKINTSNTTDMYTRIYLDAGNNFSTTDPSSPYYGKQIVVEFDTMNAGANGNNDNPFMQLRPTYGGVETTPIYLGYGSNQIQYRHGEFANKNTTDEWKKDWYVAYQPTLGANSHKVKYVVEQNMTNFDSTRFYHDGQLVTRIANVETDWNKGRVFKDFIRNSYAFAVNGYDKGGTSLTSSVDYGELGALYSKTRGKTDGTAATIYIDNIKVYAIDPITFTGLSKDEGVNLEAGVVANFSQPFNATADTFAVSLLSDETKIDGAITAVNMSADKKSATIKFNTAVLGNNKEFKLWVAEDLTSEAGAIYYKDLDGVKPGEEYVVLSEFKTYEKFSVLEAPESISKLIPNDPRNVEFKTTAAVASVSATYAGGAVKTSMIGTSAFVSFEDIAEPTDGTLAVTITSQDGQTINLSIPVTAISDEINYIFNDNLEGLQEGSLFSADTEGQSLTVGNFIFNTKAASLGAAGTATIEKDNVQGNVLKFASKGVNNFAVIYKGDESDMAGKVLVYQTKYYFPSDYQNTTKYGDQGAAASPADSLTYTGSPLAPSFRPRTGPKISYTSGEYYYNRISKDFDVTPNGWTDITVVLDKTRAGTLNDPETTRRYFGEELNIVPFSDQKGDKVNHNMYDVPPYTYRGTYDFSAYSTGFTSGGTNKFSITKMYGIYNMLPNTDGTAAYIKLDDFRAFYTDKFQVTSVSDNAAAFIPTKHTLKVVLNHKIDAAQLSEIKVLDDAGVEIEGCTAEVANGGYAFDIRLPAEKVEIGKTYSVVVTPLFHDITSYQGLATNNVDKEIAKVTIAEFVSFTATGYQASFTNFEQGRTATTDITLSVATKLTNTDAKTAFKVVNDENVEVTEGWTATVSDDQKTITLDFKNLPTDNYTITSTDALVNKDGDKLDGDAVSITITAKVSKIEIFKDDFEDTNAYTTDVDWLDTAPTNGKWGTYQSTAADANFIGVTATLPAAAKHLSGRALKVYADNAAAYTVTAKALANVDMSKYPGKVIIYEGDIYAASTADDSRMYNPSFSSDNNTTPLCIKYSSVGSFKLEGAYFAPKSTSYATAEKAHFGAYHSNNAQDAHLRFVVDQNNQLETIRYYVNDVVAGQREYTYLTDHPLYGQMKYDYPMSLTLSKSQDLNRGPFKGVIFRAKSSTSAAGEFYIDNLKVYLVDAFEITNVEGASTAFNAAKNNVTFTFNNPVLSKENVLANLKLVDSTGAEVANALSVELADANYQAVVSIDQSKILGGADYKIVVSPDLRDENNVGLAVKYVWENYTSTGGSATIDGKAYTWVADGKGKVTAFNPYSTTVGKDFDANGYITDTAAMKLDTVIKTTKATSLYAEATAATVEGTNVKTTLTFTNPETDTLDVWYIVAAYGDYNEMLGCQAAALKVENGILDPIPIDFTVKKSNVKSVKVYIWDGYKTMIPYQDAETIFGQ